MSDMLTPRCQRCGHYWATDTRPDNLAAKFCPNCIPLITHRLTFDNPHNRTVRAAS